MDKFYRNFIVRGSQTYLGPQTSLKTSMAKFCQVQGESSILRNTNLNGDTIAPT